MNLRRTRKSEKSILESLSGSRQQQLDQVIAMEMKIGLHLRQRQQLVMTPKLQQALKLLQMPAIELQQMLKQEIMENPLLDEEEDYLETQEEERQETEVSKEEEKKTES